jgi:hypothetical protein
MFSCKCQLQLYMVKDMLASWFRTITHSRGRVACASEVECCPRPPLTQPATFTHHSLHAACIFAARM